MYSDRAVSGWNSYNCWKVKFAEGEELTQPLTIYSEPEEQKKKRSVSSSPEAQPPSSALQEAMSLLPVPIWQLVKQKYVTSKLISFAVSTISRYPAQSSHEVTRYQR